MQARLSRAIGLLFVLSVVGCAARAAGAKDMWLPAAVDHVDRHYTVLIHIDEHGREYVRSLDLSQLGLPVSSKPTYWHDNEAYYPARSLRRYSVHIDPLSGYAYFTRRQRPELAHPPARELLVDVVLNGQRLPEPILLRYRHGELILANSALRALRLDPRRIRFLLKRRDEVPVQAVAGGDYAIDYQALVLRMSVPAYLFLPLRVSALPPAPPPGARTSGIGAMLSYDVASGIDEQHQIWRSGIFDLAVAGSRDTCATRYAQFPYRSGLHRLDSQCTFDWVRHRRSMTLGDTVAVDDLSGAAVRYGGIRIGTDFGLTPYYITQPTVSLAGSARIPSTLEVWVDRMLALTQPVPAGPFQITNIPVRSGAGEVHAVLSNAAGSQLLGPQPIYSDASLLRPGLSAWTFEAGKLRENYALPGDRYTDSFASFDLSRGLTSWLTVSPHAEVMRSFGRVALGGSIRLGHFALLQLSGSASELSDGHRGFSYTERLSRHGDFLSFSISHQVTDADFVQLGYPTPGTSPADVSQASIGVSLPGGMSMTFNGSRSLLRDSESLRLVSAAMTIPAGRLGDLLLTAFQPIEPAGARFYMATLTVPLDARTNASASAFGQGAAEEEWAQLQRNAPLGPGVGYRILAGRDRGGPLAEADLTAQASAATLRLAASDTDGASAGHAEISGAITASTAGIHLTRDRSGSTAIVRLPWPGVRIYDNGDLAAVTNPRGVAVVPGLLPFQENRLELDMNDIPMGAEVRKPEVTIVPGRQQIVDAHFGAKQERHVSANLIYSRTGAAVPAGAIATVAGARAAHPVGYGGLVYFALPASGPVTLEVRWPHARCTATLDPGHDTKAIVELNRVWCH